MIPRFYCRVITVHPRPISIPGRALDQVGSTLWIDSPVVDGIASKFDCNKSMAACLMGGYLASFAYCSIVVRLLENNEF